MDVYLHGQKLESIFELLGTKENDITFGVGWTLGQCPHLLKAVLEHVGLKDETVEEIRLQEYGEDRGYTDIEILGARIHLIVEAKRGWWLPGTLQWERYSGRFTSEHRTVRRFLAMSDCTQQWASLHLPAEEHGIELRYLGWRDLARMAERAGGTNADKRLLGELQIYLKKVATMQKLDTNWVYVVSLGSGNPDGASISWVDIIEKKHMYFHPVGKGWPKEPPTYVAFRYGGKLQSIHHVNEFQVSMNLRDQIPELAAGFGSDGPNFLYTLGPAIRPPRETRTGAGIKRNSRRWVSLDLLLTSETISEAWEKTRERWQGSKQ